jgi:hypothetical protein
MSEQRFLFFESHPFGEFVLGAVWARLFLKLFAMHSPLKFYGKILNSNGTRSTQSTRSQNIMTIGQFFISSTTTVRFPIRIH